MPIDDEAFARTLRARIDAAVPVVPVDVPGAVRQGRRRRALRAGAGTGALAVGLVALAVGVPSVLGRTPDGRDLAAASSAQNGDPAVSDAATLTGDPLVIQVTVGSDGDGMDVTTWTLGDQKVEVLRAEVARAAEEAMALAAPGATQADLPSEYLGWLSATYQLSTPPDASVVTSVPSGEWGSHQGTCLRAAGWEVQVGDAGYSVTLRSGGVKELGRDQYVCAVEYPADLG
ncbi:hypothetical protein ACGIF2_09755 [Cellulomonas sp. P22]|uniref:hypothetical protein n=1 Tax=Cellulomonas sp. P22 TaxID=3373189 RepID=UPI0037B60D53